MRVVGHEALHSSILKTKVKDENKSERWNQKFKIEIESRKKVKTWNLKLKAKTKMKIKKPSWKRK